MKRLSFCVIILVGISATAQVEPNRRPQPCTHTEHGKCAVDTVRFDTIMNTHRKLQQLLRDEMQMKDSDP